MADPGVHLRVHIRTRHRTAAAPVRPPTPTYIGGVPATSRARMESPMTISRAVFVSLVLSFVAGCGISRKGSGDTAAVQQGDTATDASGDTAAAR